MNKILVVLVILIAVVGGIVYMMKKEAAQPAPVVTTTQETPQQPKTTAKLNTITFAENASSTDAKIEQAKLAESGYIVVYRTDAEGEVTMAGHSDVLTAGEHKNVSIKLDAALQAKDVIVAVLHKDNGDGKFDTNDSPVVEQTAYVTAVDVVNVPKAAADASLTTRVEAFLNGNAQETAAKAEAEAKKDVLEVTVTAENYKFLPATIKAKLGQTVRVKFVNSGGYHDFVIDEFKGAKTKQIQGGNTETIEFVVDQKGTFEYYCSVGSHRAMGMVGKLTVE